MTLPFRKSKALKGLALLLPVLLAACGGEGESASNKPAPTPAASGPASARTALPAAAWRAPAPAAVQLLGAKAEFTGEKPGPGATLARWSGKDLEAWGPKRLPEGLRFVSPPLGPELNEAVTLRITLRPGGAKTIKVLPVLKVRKAQNVQRAIRGFEIPVPPDTAPDQPVTLESDVKETLRGNWADEAGENRLQNFEITLPEADPAKARIDEIVFESEAALFSHAAAGILDVDREGIIRPAFFVNPGALARVSVDVPAGEPELRWYDAALGGAGQRTVSVVAAGKKTLLWKGEGSSPLWEHQAAALKPWSGQKITLELAAAGPAAKGGQEIGFFGIPRIVQSRADAATPDVIVYMIDMLRADYLGAWGGKVEGVSPVIDRLAGEGVAFRNTLSSSSWTKPAIPTLMTGLWETTHRVGAQAYTDRLPAGVPVIQERFRNAGWRTASFAANPLGSTLSGLTRGFDTALPPRFWKGNIGPLGSPAANQLQQELYAFIADEPDQPVFAYLHTMEVHRYAEPLYANPPAGMKPYHMAMQDADHKLGQMIDHWASLKRGRDLLLVLVADHGHSFGEHGKEGHGLSVYQAEIHIPLIFWAQGSLEPKWVKELAALADVAPTLADLFKLPALPGVQGTSLLSSMRGPARQLHEFLPASLLRFVRFPDAPQQFTVVTADLEKCHRVIGEGTNEFDLKTDPMEQKPRPAKPGPLLSLLERYLEDQKKTSAEFRRRHGSGVAGAIDTESAENLRALGYIQ